MQKKKKKKLKIRVYDNEKMGGDRGSVTAFSLNIPMASSGTLNTTKSWSSAVVMH